MNLFYFAGRWIPSSRSDCNHTCLLCQATETSFLCSQQECSYFNVVSLLLIKNVCFLLFWKNIKEIFILMYVVTYLKSNNKNKQNKCTVFIRGHHADIGGITPGSMPPHSTFLWQEGATFKSFKVRWIDRFYRYWRYQTRLHASSFNFSLAGGSYLQTIQGQKDRQIINILEV